ncbi:uncharacterized protein LOC123513056 [Portunus trituberculatus]|uniref:uncharacterized protein LOC123513056 n=1 Tax=Portunus trituberculatus TaxID=210409 RepID=UPI001E1D1C63|nr:uncharacterized protein LOC123513056 [Portunus trituberculatus]
MLREWVKVGAATHSTHIHTFRFGARRQEQHAGRQCSKKTSVTLPSYSDMADRSEAQDSSNIEIIECREPHLEASQDLELLAQEIAEAAVEDERKSRTPSPSPPQTLPSLACEAATREDSPEEDQEEEEKEEDDDDDDDDEGLDKCEDDLTQLEEEAADKVRPSSPVDEASWVLVDATDDEACNSEFPEQKFSVYRKFLARGDLRQKLADLGFFTDPTAEASGDDRLTEQSLQNLVMSCSESIVICDLPEEGEGEDSTGQVFIKDSPDGPGMPSWRGSIAGATVEVEMERRGGLMVAAVTVWHRDLLSALNSLRNLVSSAGLVSYADVDVTSLLARAA